jgi:hypothetical protein
MMTDKYGYWGKMLHQLAYYDFVALAKSEREAAEATKEGSAAAKEYAEVLTDEEVKALKEAEETLQSYNASFIEGVMNISAANDDFAESQAAVNVKASEAQAEVDNLIKNGWWPLSEKVLDAKKKVQDLGDEFENNAKKHKEATESILLVLCLTE